MTTFTLGLGVDGTVTYSSDYKTAADLSEPPTDARLDYYNILKGVGNWSVPTEGNETTVDDLWHAAVNGKGVYFSAKDPAQLASGLDEALAAIGAKIGAGAAAATSTLNPVTSDNYAYVASYTTVSWTGNLEARSINTITGKVNKAASWCVENTQAGTCVAPGAVVASSSGSSTVYNCVTSVASESACSSPGMYDSAVGTCNVTLPIACAGRMTAPGVVGASTDGRNIYTKSSSGTSLVPFEIANLNSTYFDAAKQAGLSQWSTMTSTQKSALTGANLVKFLRGQNGYEDRASNALDNRLYRYRGAVLGDAVESQPAHIAKPTFSYLDSGYDAFKTTNASRAGTVYMGANDGMLHAFNAATGDERWAYIPTMLHPNLWKLADKNYATLHTYYANGSPIISDIYSGGAWKTILVAGLNGGGRGYYALDITNPTTPTLLWEFDTTSQNNLGYSFARPVITKKSDGTWVVLITSGYNNTSPGNGCGYLYVLNAATGTQLSALPTGACSSSGLGKIAVWADDPEKNNTATYTYGGDLLGNLWRFDINSGAVVKLAELKDSSGNAQPITTSPELGQIENQRVVFVGTGKYLEITDLTNTQQQTIYAIKDSDPYPTSSPSATLVNPRSSSSMKMQTFSTSGAYRQSTGETINWLTDRGWYINFPDSGERQNVDSQLILGTLLVPSIVPSNTVCAPGGTGWLNFVDYRTGQGREDSLNQYASLKTNAPIVGFNVITLPSGKKSVSIVTSDDPTPASVGDGIIGFDPLTSGFQKKRVIWREYIPQ
jgi:type IV pilus assembly protein PilY1